MRVLFANLFHETHTFAGGRTRLADFTVARGDEVLEKLGDGSRTDGFLSTAARLGLEVVPAADYVALASGPVSDEVITAFLRDFEAAVACSEGSIDALFVGVHGGMVSESMDDVEGCLLPRLRRMAACRSRSGSRVPVYGVTDMHANVSYDMAANAALLTYQKNPHTDAYATAARATELLAATEQSGQTLFTSHYALPIILSPAETATADSPLAEVAAIARAYESENSDVVAVNVHAGYAYADIADTGVSIDVLARTRGLKHTALLEEARAIMSAHARRPRPSAPGPDEVLATVSAGNPAPVVIADPCDNVGAGAPGDTTGLLRAFLRRQDLRSLAVLCDPLAVSEYWSYAVGSEYDVSIGGRSGVDGLGSVNAAARLILKADGNFELLDRQSHMAASVGSRTTQGRTLVFQIARAVVVVHSRRTLPFDLGQLTSLGLDPAAFDVIGVKAAVAHRRAYEKVARGFAVAETSGCCPADLRSLPYERVRRPIFPLDALPDFRIWGNR